MKAYLQQLERNVAVQAGRLSALEQKNQLFMCMLVDFEECFNVLGQRIRKRKHRPRDTSETEGDGGDDSRKRVRFLGSGFRQGTEIRRDCSDE